MADVFGAPRTVRNLRFRAARAGQEPVWEQAAGRFTSRLVPADDKDMGADMQEGEPRLPTENDDVAHTPSPIAASPAASASRVYRSRKYGEPRLKVLLAEDKPSDTAAFRRAVASAGNRYDVRIVENGGDARDLLMHASGATSWFPDCVVLNLNLPRKFGLEILRELRTQDGPETLPVVVWTISERECDIQAAYGLGISAYYVKPVTESEMVAQVRAMLEALWWTTSFQHRAPVR